MSKSPRNFFVCIVLCPVVWALCDIYTQSFFQNSPISLVRVILILGIVPGALVGICSGWRRLGMLPVVCVAVLTGVVSYAAFWISPLLAESLLR
jgi:hypothetical protein